MSGERGAGRRRTLCLGFGALALAPQRAHGRPAARAELSSLAMGARVRVQALATDGATARRACTAALRAMHRVDALMSLFDSGSEISRLNRQGWLTQPDAWTLQVLQLAQSVAEQTGGAFDVTVQPLWRLFDRHAARGALPSVADVDAVRARVGWRGLQVGPGRVGLARGGMAVTLNGIAQGFAADRARDAMQAAGALAGLVDAGELAALGRAPSGAAWSAALSVPRHRLLEPIALDSCVATSSDDASAFSRDRRHHHILDPSTGWSPLALSAASVVATSAALADAWSTAVLVGGEAMARRALDLGAASRVWLVDKRGRSWWVS